MAVFEFEGYDGTTFTDLFVQRSSSSGPGWFIFGRDKNKYGCNDDGTGRYVKLCGWVREGKARNYNGTVRIGWPTRKAAQQALNAVRPVRTSAHAYHATSPCRHAWVDLPDGRTVALFVNIETKLIVVDVVDADEKGGSEILRRNV